MGAAWEHDEGTGNGRKIEGAPLIWSCDPFKRMNMIGMNIQPVDIKGYVAGRYIPRILDS